MSETKRIYRSYGIRDDIYAKAKAKMEAENKGKHHQMKNSLSRIAAKAIIDYAYPNKK